MSASRCRSCRSEASRGGGRREGPVGGEGEGADRQGVQKAPIVQRERGQAVRLRQDARAGRQGSLLHGIRALDGV